MTRSIGCVSSSQNACSDPYAPFHSFPGLEESVQCQVDCEAFCIFSFSAMPAGSRREGSWYHHRYSTWCVLPSHCCVRSQHATENVLATGSMLVRHRLYTICMVVMYIVVLLHVCTWLRDVLCASCLSAFSKRCRRETTTTPKQQSSVK